MYNYSLLEREKGIMNRQEQVLKIKELCNKVLLESDFDTIEDIISDIYFSNKNFKDFETGYPQHYHLRGKMQKLI